jgi:hypothetical protein
MAGMIEKMLRPGQRVQLPFNCRLAMCFPKNWTTLPSSSSYTCGFHLPRRYLHTRGRAVTVDSPPAISNTNTVCTYPNYLAVPSTTVHTYPGS